MTKQPKIGPTGNFPEGKVDADDKGELVTELSIRNGKIILNFGVPVEWVAMTPSGARELANLLLKGADRASN